MSSREPDEMVVERMIEAIRPHMPNHRFDHLRNVAIAAIRVGTQGRDAMIEEVAQAHDFSAAQCRSMAARLRGTDADAAKENLWRAEFHETSAKGIRDLASPEVTAPAAPEQLCRICGEPWPCTCGSPHAAPAPPAASDLQRAWRVLGQTCSYTGMTEGTKLAERIAAEFGVIRAEGERAEREVCMQIARDHHAPSVLRAIGDRALAASRP